MSEYVLEIVLFQLAEGVSDAEFLTAARGVEPWLEQQPGFVKRQINRDSQGHWLDLIHWNSLEEAQAAAAQIMSKPEGQAFGATIKPESIQMFHMRSVHDLVN